MRRAHNGRGNCGIYALRASQDRPSFDVSQMTVIDGRERGAGPAASALEVKDRRDIIV
jgi:hypothetical protein